VCRLCNLDAERFRKIAFEKMEPQERKHERSYITQPNCGLGRRSVCHLPGAALYAGFYLLPRDGFQKVICALCKRNRKVRARNALPEGFISAKQAFHWIDIRSD